jgi:hypothetical protein
MGKGALVRYIVISRYPAMIATRSVRVENRPSVETGRVEEALNNPNDPTTTNMSHHSAMLKPQL